MTRKLLFGNWPKYSVISLQSARSLPYVENRTKLWENRISLTLLWICPYDLRYFSQLRVTATRHAVQMVEHSSCIQTYLAPRVFNNAVAKQPIAARFQKELHSQAPILQRLTHMPNFTRRERSHYSSWCIKLNMCISLCSAEALLSRASEPTNPLLHAPCLNYNSHSPSRFRFST